MSSLVERAIVHCSVNQASLHLARYFRARGNSDGDIARLNLRADVQVPGSNTFRLERTAIATLTPLHARGEMLPHYAVNWTPERSGPYPTFNGDLAIENADDYHSFYLVLKGTYEPPLGVLGAAFDAVVGHRIAELTARNLLATIADSIEADFTVVETSKAQARAKAATTAH